MGDPFKSTFKFFKDFLSSASLISKSSCFAYACLNLTWMTPPIATNCL